MRDLRQASSHEMTTRAVILGFGVLTYIIFLSSMLYAIGFVRNIVVPKSIDTGDESSVSTALLVDLSLLALFGIQHSLMARPVFKGWLTRHVPQSLERSIYVLLSSFALILLFWQWRPLAYDVWNVRAAGVSVMLDVLFGMGWGLAVLSTFLIDHADLFGLRQVYFAFRGIAYRPVGFKQPVIYQYVRHPLMLGFLVAFWATPRMTIGHLIFAAGMTVYIFIGVSLEERDLVRAHGRAYADYRRHVPMLLPIRRGKR
jgi:protein-S-isoprenylcysteine O-methyltransferase Ste14